MKKNFETLWQKHKMLLLLTCGAILLQMVVGALLWERLPEQIATHFDFNNQPDGYSSRMFTVFGMPLILLFLHVVCLATISMPDEKRMVHSRKMRALMWFVVPAVSLLMTVVVYGYALGAPFHVGRVVVPFVGILLAVTGNYMPKVRRNPTMGIRVPWTLADEENWDKTHRFAAPVWVLGGVLLTVLGLIGYTRWMAFALLMVLVFLPAIYSFALYLKKK